MVLFFSTFSYAKRQVVLVNGNIPSEIQDINLDIFLKDLNYADLGASELGSIAEKVLHLTESIIEENDSQKPLYLVIEDSMSVDASYAKSKVGPDILTVSLGLLNFSDNDDELKFYIGHELEHESSALNARVKNSAAFNGLYSGQIKHQIEKGKDKLLDRIAESEVDVKSVINRLYRKGSNPIAGRNALIKLQNRLSLDNSHSNMSSRISAVEGALLLMKRKYGIQFDPNSFSQNTVNQEFKSYFKTEAFKKERKRKFDNELDELWVQLDEIGSLLKTPLRLIRQNNDLSNKLDRSIYELGKKVNFNWISSLVDRLFFGIENTDENLKRSMEVIGSIYQKIATIRDQVIKINDLKDIAIWNNREFLYPSIESPIENNHTQSHPLYIKFNEVRKLEKKKKDLLWRMQNNDFTSYMENDSTTSLKMAELDMSTIDERIRVAKKNAEEFMDKWYNFGNERRYFIDEIYKIIEGFSALSVGSTIPLKYRKFPEIVSRYQKYIGAEIANTRQALKILANSEKSMAIIESEPISNLAINLI